ncbi:MAG TPA: ATP-dependent Clp protease proteolytic subunit [Actinomycetes bacterium]|nr:ATP-dependent Clp protease proteolytic subunit [Actinomycetes bacterium]
MSHEPWRRPPTEPRPGEPGLPEPRAAEPTGMPPWLSDKLFDRRVVMVAGWLDAERASRAGGELMLHDADSDDPVELYLTDLDADLDAAITLLDVVELMGVPVQVSVAGRLRGPAVALLAAGDQRVMRPHSTVELCEPRLAVAAGRASELAAQAADYARRLRRIQERIASTCGRPVDEIAADMRTGRFLDAEAAAGYGLTS